jgi:hypothetical protein
MVLGKQNLRIRQGLGDWEWCMDVDMGTAVQVREAQRGAQSGLEFRDLGLYYKKKIQSPEYTKNISKTPTF